MGVQVRRLNAEPADQPRRRKGLGLGRSKDDLHRVPCRGTAPSRHHGRTGISPTMLAWAKCLATFDPNRQMLANFGRILALLCRMSAGGGSSPEQAMRETPGGRPAVCETLLTSSSTGSCMCNLFLTLARLFRTYLCKSNFRLWGPEVRSANPSRDASLTARLRANRPVLLHRQVLVGVRIPPPPRPLAPPLLHGPTAHLAREADQHYGPKLQHVSHEFTPLKALVGFRPMVCRSHMSAACSVNHAATGRPHGIRSPILFSKLFSLRA